MLKGTRRGRLTRPNGAVENATCKQAHRACLRPSPRAAGGRVCNEPADQGASQTGPNTHREGPTEAKRRCIRIQLRQQKTRKPRSPREGERTDAAGRSATVNPLPTSPTPPRHLDPGGTAPNRRPRAARERTSRGSSGSRVRDPRQTHSQQPAQVRLLRLHPRREATYRNRDRPCVSTPTGAPRPQSPGHQTRERFLPASPTRRW